MRRRAVCLSRPRLGAPGGRAAAAAGARRHRRLRPRPARRAGRVPPARATASTWRSWPAGSRPPGGRRRPAGARSACPCTRRACPSPLLTRAWDHGLLRAPDGLRHRALGLAGRTAAARGPAGAGWSSRCTTWPGAGIPKRRRGAGRAGTRPPCGGPPVAGPPSSCPSRLVAADLIALRRRRRPGSRVVPERRRPPARPRPGGHRRAPAQGRACRASSSSPWARSNRARTSTAWCEAFGRVRASLPGPWPLVIVGPTGWGPEPVRPAPADGVVFTGARPRPRAVRALPARPCLRLRAADRGLRAAPARGHAGGHARPWCPTRCRACTTWARPEPAAGAASSTRSTSTTSHAGLAAVLTDDELRADLARRGAAYARDPDLARRGPRPHRRSGGRCRDERASWRLTARRLGRPGPPRRCGLLHHGAGRRPRSHATTSASRWSPGAATSSVGTPWPGAAAVRGAVPASRPGRLAFEQLAPRFRAALRAGSRSITGRTTRCRPGRRCRVP